MQRRYKNKRSNAMIEFVKENLLSMVFFLAVFILLLYAVGNTGRSRKIAEKRVVEESIWRAVVSCYAIEGVYPPSCEYLCDNYGLSIDDRYYVRYEIFASNIMPEITVIEVSK